MSPLHSIKNIPVLTEVIAPRPPAESQAGGAVEKTAEQPAAPPSQKRAAPAVAIPTVADFLNSEREWDELEHRLTERILQQAQERIGFILAHAIKDSMAVVLQKAVEELAAEVRRDLQNTMEVVVSHAVTQEINSLQQKRANMSDNVQVKDGA